MNNKVHLETVSVINQMMSVYIQYYISKDGNINIISLVYVDTYC